MRWGSRCLANLVWVSRHKEKSGQEALLNNTQSNGREKGKENKYERILEMVQYLY